MKTVTIEQFMGFGPCYKKDKIKEIAGDKVEWAALDVLRLDSVPAEDRLWAVLREEFIDAHILHEFACRCAEKALALVENPDTRSINAIVVKRAWLNGEATDEQLDAARHAAWCAARYAAWSAALCAARYAAWSAALCAARYAARDAAWGATSYAARHAALCAARHAGWSAASSAAWDAQVTMLIEMLGG